MAVAGLLLWLAFKNFNIKEIISRLKSADYRWVYLSMFFAIISHLIRAYRWTLMLKPMGYKPKTSHAFLSVMIGYMANIALPRMGEITRCVVLKRTDGVAIPASFGTVIVERIIDLIMLVIVILLALFFQFGLISSFFEGLITKSRFTSSTPLYLWVILAFVIITGIVLTLWFFRGKITHTKIYKKLKPFIGELINGVMSIRKVENKPVFFIATLFIWVFYYLMSYIMIFSFPATSGLSPLAGIVILMAGGLGMSAPVQGGIGAYHIFVSSALLLYGIKYEDGIVYATLMHTSQMVFLIVAGSICLLISLLISRKQINNEPGKQ